MRWRALWILAVAWLGYLNSLDNSFHYDDSHSIADNSHLRLLANIPRFFVDPGMFSAEPAMAMYRPALLATFALNYAAGGYRVRGYHLVNILLHSLAALLVYKIIGRVAGSQSAGWWAGMLFALHPIHSQAVNYISSRSEVLSVLGVLAAFYLAGGRRSGLAWGAYGLALLSKEGAVVLVALLAFCEWLRPADQREWRAHLPFWGMTLGYLGILSLNGFLPRSLGQEVRPLEAQVCTQLKALVYYLQLVAMPVHLSVEHFFRISQRPGEGAVALSLLLVVSLCWCAWHNRRAPASQGLFWFLAGLGLTFAVPLNVLVSEHRLYLPFIGLLLAVPLGSPRLKWAGLIALGLLGVLTFQRNRVWQDEFTLWQDAVARAPGMFRAQSNWGMARYARGQVEEALQAFEKSLQLNPRYSKTWSNLGLAYQDLGRDQEAEQAYQQALALRPDLAGTYNNLGHLKAEQGQAQQGEAYLRQALQIDPGYARARVNLGLLYQRQGRQEEAAGEYQAALRLDPGCAEALNNLGLLYLDQGRPAEAAAALQRALRLRPEYQEAQLNLQLLELRQEGVSPAQAYGRLVERFPAQVELWLSLGRSRALQGEWEGAVAAYEQALRLRPQRRGIYPALASAYQGLGRLPEAIAAYGRAIAESPGDPALHNNLAAALAASGRIGEAIQATRRALELDPANARAAQNLRRLLQAARGE